MFTTDEDLVWICQYCGEHNSVWVDLTVDKRYDFIEDCSICCRPNRIIIRIDDADNITLESRPSDE